MKLEPDLRAAFMAEAEAARRPVSQVMREFVQRQQEAREYESFLRNKVETARGSMRAGLGQSNDDVEARFAARRDRFADKA
jgi:hypothetical protein